MIELSEIEQVTRKRLSSLCKDYRELAEEMAGLKVAAQLVKEEIARLAEDNGWDRVDAEEWRLSRRVSRRSRVVPERLLTMGLTTDQIEEATEITETQYWEIRGM